MSAAVITMLSFAVAGGVVSWVAICTILALFGSSSETGRSQFHHSPGHSAPRLGGLALAASFLAVSLCSLLLVGSDNLEFRRSLVLVFGALAAFGLGLLDDIKPLGAKKKLAGQLLIAFVVWLGGIQVENFQNPFSHTIYSLASWGCLFTVFWLVAFPNLINLIDGIDGLAGGISLMLMALLCYVARMANVTFPTYCAAGMVGGLLAFLRFNFPPAKIYMGDGGAYLLGFLIASLSIVNSHKGVVAEALIAPLFVLGLPLLDAALAVLRRGVRGFPIFRPDRSHIHHKLLEIGYTPRRALATLYFASLFFLSLALVAYWSRGRLTPLLFGFAGVFLILASRFFSFSRGWLSVGEHLRRSMRMREVIQYTLTLSQWLEMEGRRCDSVENLWSDFKFLAMKVGFTRVSLHSAEGDFLWESSNCPPELENCHHRQLLIDPKRRLVFDFWMAADAIDGDLFGHLCEISAEAWQKASDAYYTAAAASQRTGASLAPVGRLPSPNRSYVPISWDGSADAVVVRR